MKEFIPFVALAVGSPIPTPLVTRLMEAAIIGAVVTYGTVKSIGSDIDYIKQEIVSIKAEQIQVRRDLYRPLLAP